MKTIKKLGVMSVAKFQAVMFAIVALLEAIVVTFVMKAVGGMASSFMVESGFEANSINTEMLNSTLSNFGVGAIIIAPILGAIFGFIMGAIVAFLYNLVAKWVGGIEIELE